VETNIATEITRTVVAWALVTLATKLITDDQNVPEAIKRAVDLALSIALTLALR
jgi:hypothetical protein